MRNHMKYFLLLFVYFIFLLIFFKPPVSAQDYVRLGKVGEWNSYGDFRSVDAKEINGVTYAFCATSKGMAVFSIRYENTGENRTKVDVSFISFVPLGYCTDIVIEERGGFKKDFYAYITKRNKGLYIRNVTNPALSYHVGSCNAPGLGNAVVISGEYAFVCGLGSLHVIDISDPIGPFIVGSCEIPGSAYGIVISGEYAFVVGWLKGLQVIDISDPTGPIIIGSCDIFDDIPAYTYGIAIYGAYAFVVNVYNGLQVIDICDPTRPRVVGSSSIDGYAYEVAISGEYAFVAYHTDWEEGGLRIIDISDPTGPRIADSCDTFGDGRGVAIFGEYAFVGGLEGLHVIDISDPIGPVIIGTCNTPGDAYGIAISGEYAFAADYESGLQVINISDPTGPFIVGSCDTPGSAIEVAISGEYAFVADYESGLQVINVSDLTGPFIVGSCNTPGSAIGVAISGEYAFVADGGSGLQVINISDPTEPFIVDSCDTPDSAIEVTISGEYAFVADGGSGLQVINISDPTGPFIIGSCITKSYAQGITISGEYAFVADDVSGLQVIDISDPTGPFIVGSCITMSYAQGVAISGEYAFVVGGYRDLQVIDISDPTRPFIVDSCITMSYAQGIAISGDYAFVAHKRQGLQVIDVSKPTGPFIVNSCITKSYAQGIIISGEYAFVADDVSGLQVIDISDPTGPKIAGSYATPGYARGVAIARIGDVDYAFVADDYSGLQVIDISDPTGPKIAGSCATPGYARGVAIARIGDVDYAFVADRYSGLQVIDISDPTGPKIAGSYDTPGSAYGVAIARIGDVDYAFVADGSNGLVKLKINTGLPPEGKGNLILVAGGNIDYKALSQKTTNPTMRKRGYTFDPFDPNESYWNPKASYWQITQTLANHIFNTFQRSGYEVYDIYYFNPDPIQDTDNDGFPNQLVVDDRYPTREGLIDIIKEFPEDLGKNHIANNGPLYIYLIGHAAEDQFLITPNEIITARDIRDAIDQFRNGYTDNEGTYHPGTNRQVVVIIESAASGTFINDLAGPGITVITSTDDGSSYIKPDFSDPNHIPYNSFTKAFWDALGPHLDPNNIPEGPPETLNTRINELIKEAFIEARNKLNEWALEGQPFADQTPQMYIPGGPIDISIYPEDPNKPYDPNNPEAPLIITQEDPITLIPKVYYTDGNTITLDPHHLIFLSSRSQVFNPYDPNQLEIDTENLDHILIHPARARNGLCTLIAYPDPDYYPDILLTARLSIEISIPGNTIAGGDKALIVAGYHAVEGIPDIIWKSTNIIANHAYLSLRKKRYGHDDIFYLNPLYKQDVDQNGKYDDIDGHPRIEKIDWAINQIKQTGAEELLIFLVNHGLTETFNLNPKGEELTAQYLKERIIALAPSSEEEKHVQKTITLLIDACYSGSFIPALQNNLQPQADPNQIIIITSADPNETAQFLADGLNSFSYPFFDEYLLTNSIFNSYQHACRFIPPFDQTPQISDPDLARKRDKALEYFIDEARPVITERDFSREGENLTVTAQVYSLSGIDRVRIIITTYEGALTAPEGGPRTAEPTDLIPDPNNSPYGGEYTLQINDPYQDDFNYQIILSAMDKKGKVVTERINVNNQEQNTTGAIILVTDYSAAPSVSQYIYEQSQRAYRILKEKQIRDDDIQNDIYYVKTRMDYPEERIDNTPASFDMEAISTWLQERSYQVLLIYLIGESGYDAQGEVYFKLANNNPIYPSDLEAHIHTQDGFRVLLFCEMPNARGFISRFSLKPDRAAIASPYNEIPLFSKLFFSNINSFYTVGEAFREAYRVSSKACQRPPSDFIYFPDLVPTSLGKICEKLPYRLGNREAGEDPALIKETRVLEGTYTLTLQLKVNESARIKTPWIELHTPSGYISHSLLEQRDANICLWESPPLPKDRPYSKVIFYVEQIQDANQPGITDSRELAITLFSQDSGETPYEPNDTQEYAYPIVIGIPQRHTFHDTNDADWVYFYAHEGEEYEIKANESKEGYFTLITLCDANGIMIQQKDFFNPFYISQFWPWHCNQNGYYTLRVKSAAHPEDIPFSYSLSVGKAQNPTPKAYIQGRVVDQSHKGINGLNVYVRTDINTWKTSTGSIKNVRRPAPYATVIPTIKTEGWFFIENLPAPGSYTIKVTAKDDPNTILAEPGSTYLYENKIHWIDDIVIVQDLLPSQKDTDKEAIDGFERAYTHWQQILGGQYPPWMDTDDDVFTNQEEFLNGTDPSDPNNPILAYGLYHLYPGLNLFPYHLSDYYLSESYSTYPYWASDFCNERLEECHSFWGYNKEENVWDYWYRDSGGNDFPLEKGKGYIIYKHTPEFIYQEAQNSITFLIPGINVIGISPIPEGSPYKSYTSFQFLRDRKKEGIKSISRYNHDQEVGHKSKDIRETSYLFFGRPAGIEFPVLHNEVYLIEVKKLNR